MLRRLIGYLGTGTGLVLTAFWGTAAMVCYPFTGARGVRACSRLWGRTLLRAGLVHVAVRGADKLDLSKPHIYVSNHQSGLDILVLIGHLPQFPHFVAKAELKKAPFIGFALKAAGHIFIDRSNHKVAIETLKAAGAEVRAGKSVAVFPEGTRFPPRVLGPFKRGAFVLARAAGVPIVPVGLVGSAERMAARKVYTVPGVVGLRIGDPILPEDFPDQDEQLAALARAEVRKLAGPSAARLPDKR
jgi:1-acyl-sn-glycerol-3-phosphate acyltransferase